MSHHGKNPICEDMETLRECTEHDLPSREETARAVRARLGRTLREGSIMKFTRSAGFRPVAATAISVAIVAIALLVIPISYVRTVGYQATLSLPSVNLVQGQGIAGEFAKLLNTKDYNCNLDAVNGATIMARVPVRSPRVVKGLAMGYAQRLALRGIAARSQVVPVTQRFSGNAYAAAANRLYQIHVNSDGKTNEQITEELSAQFEAAGLPGAVVRVTGDGSQLRMEMQWQAPPGDSSGGEKQFEVTVDGKGKAASPTP